MKQNDLVADTVLLLFSCASYFAFVFSSQTDIAIASITLLIYVFPLWIKTLNEFKTTIKPKRLFMIDVAVIALGGVSLLLALAGLLLVKNGHSLNIPFLIWLIIRIVPSIFVIRGVYATYLELMRYKSLSRGRE